MKKTQKIWKTSIHRGKPWRCIYFSIYLSIDRSILYIRKAIFWNLKGACTARQKKKNNPICFGVCNISGIPMRHWNASCAHLHVCTSQAGRRHFGPPCFARDQRSQYTACIKGWRFLLEKFVMKLVFSKLPISDIMRSLSARPSIPKISQCKHNWTTAHSQNNIPPSHKVRWFFFDQQSWLIAKPNKPMKRWTPGKGQSWVDNRKPCNTL